MSEATPALVVPVRQSEQKSCTPARRKPTKLTPKQRSHEAEGKIDKHWRTYFLQKLAETSNVTASAAAAGVATSRAYKTRREDPCSRRDGRGIAPVRRGARSRAA